MEQDLPLFDSLTFDEWQEGMVELFYHCDVPQVHTSDEKKILEAFRDLHQPRHLRASALTFFLAGMRAEAHLQVLFPNHHDTPEVQVYSAVEKALDEMSEPKRTMLEITMMHHLDVYLRASSDSVRARLLFPNFWQTARFFFLCGMRSYTFFLCKAHWGQ